MDANHTTQFTTTVEVVLFIKQERFHLNACIATYKLSQLMYYVSL